MEIEDKIAILADLWLNYKDLITDFTEYNDIGLPLAYLCHTNLSELTEDGVPYINETYLLLTESLGLDEDEDFNNLTDMLSKSEVGLED